MCLYIIGAMKYDPVTQPADQIPFPDPEFVDNPEPRCPCVLLLDTSGSMDDVKQAPQTLSPVEKILSEQQAPRMVRPIDELNAGLLAFRSELMADELAVKRVEISLVTFGPVRKITDFQTPDLFRAPKLKAEGDTPMGQAIEKAVEIVRERKTAYRQNGVSYYRPWIFRITANRPTIGGPQPSLYAPANRPSPSPSSRSEFMGPISTFSTASPCASLSNSMACVFARCSCGFRPV
jgi:hypothetical protein